jgi:hypothetical protein
MRYTLDYSFLVLYGAPLGVFCTNLTYFNDLLNFEEPMSDKRKNDRLDILGHVQIRQNSLDSPIDALIGDVSDSGIRIHVKQPLSGRVEILQFHFVDALGKMETDITETVKGQVAWLKQKGKWYSAGIKFDGLNHREHTAILDFLKKYLKVE